MNLENMKRSRARDVFPRMPETSDKKRFAQKRERRLEKPLAGNRKAHVRVRSFRLRWGLFAPFSHTLAQYVRDEIVANFDKRIKLRFG